MKVLAYKLSSTTNRNIKILNTRLFLYANDGTIAIMSELTFAHRLVFKASEVLVKTNNRIVFRIGNDVFVFDCVGSIDPKFFNTIFDTCECVEHTNRPICRGDVYEYYITGTPYRVVLSYDSDTADTGTTEIYCNQKLMCILKSLDVMTVAKVFRKFSTADYVLNTDFGNIVLGRNIK